MNNILKEIGLAKQQQLLSLGIAVDEVLVQVVPPYPGDPKHVCMVSWRESKYGKQEIYGCGTQEQIEESLEIILEHIKGQGTTTEEA